MNLRHFDPMKKEDEERRPASTRNKLKRSVMEAGQMLYVISPEQLGEVVKKVVEEITTEKKDTSMEKFLTVNEVVSNLGVSRTTLWRWEKYNYLTPVRVGTKVLYREAEIKKLLNN